MECTCSTHEAFFIDAQLRALAVRRPGPLCAERRIQGTEANETRCVCGVCIGFGKSPSLRRRQVLAQGDMFLNSSVSEGLPLAIIEASRAGLVVVATDVGGECIDQ